MDTFDHDCSSSTSSSSSQSDTTESVISSSSGHSTRKSGRKKFKETRHPIYHGVRLRNGSKWVCEVHKPNSNRKIWMGTFPTPEMEARAYDAATLGLRGIDSPLNFNDSAHLIKRVDSSFVSDVKKDAFEAALAFGPRCYDSKSCSSSGCFQVGNGGGTVETGFVDEEMMFNMPGFYNSMAEGLVITPPGMKKGFDWNDDTDSNIDMTLWRY